MRHGKNGIHKIETLDDIQKMLWSFASHRVITVAAKLGILRQLSQKRMTGIALANELGLDGPATVKMLRALAAHGLLEAKGETYWIPERLTEFFVPGSSDLTPFMEHSHSMYDSFGENLEGWVRGEPWKTKKRDEQSILKFALAMQAMGSGVAKQLVSSIDLGAPQKMLDVGGGLGHYSKALLAKYPDLESTVLDIEAVTKMGSQRVAGTDCERRINFMSGDYIEDDWGTGYDFVLLANILHQELGDHAAKMVRKGAEAAKPGGRVGVVDFAIDDDQRDHVLGSLFAINMRSFGDTYTEPTIKSWMTAAGLKKIERINLSDFRWLIVGHKPGETK